MDFETTTLDSNDLTTGDVVAAVALGILAAAGAYCITDKVTRFVIRKVKAHKAKKTETTPEIPAES